MQPDDLAILLRRRREELGLTQRELAEQSGVHLRSIVTIEGGKGNPSLDVLNKLCYVLRMTIAVRTK